MKLAEMCLCQEDKLPCMSEQTKVMKGDLKGSYSCQLNHSYMNCRKQASQKDALQPNRGGLRYKHAGSVRLEIAYFAYQIHIKHHLKQATSRILQHKFLLGVFDPASENPYAEIPSQVIGSPFHKLKAIQAAQKGEDLSQTCLSCSLRRRTLQ